MSHKAVRDFIKAKALALGSDVRFGYGRASDFNQIKDKGYPYVWCDPLVSSVDVVDGLLVSERYRVSLVFYKFDAADSTQEQYKLILDQTDELVQQFIRDVNEDLLTGTVADLTPGNTAIENISKNPVIKVMADVLTGWIVTFDFIVPDKFDYC